MRPLEKPAGHNQTGHKEKETQQAGRQTEQGNPEHHLAQDGTVFHVFDGLGNRICVH